MSGNQKKKLEYLLLDDSFIRYIKGNPSTNERIYWQEWQHRDPAHQILVIQAKELIKFTGNDIERIPDPHVELKKFENVQKRTIVFPNKNGYGTNKHLKGYWLSTAAVLILVVLTVGFFQFIGTKGDTDQSVEVSATSASEYQTGFGEKAFLHLTDGSRIVLNANSHLSYSWSGYGTNKQHIDIHLQGEAWFDIEPSAGQTSRLLRVHTPDGIVEVTGTVFAVQTSSEGTRAVLEEGEIRISHMTSESGLADNRSTILKPGEMAQLFPANNEIVLEKVNPKIYTSWIRDVWTLEQTPLKQVADRIEMVFGVEVHINTTSLKERTLSGTIGSRNLQLIKEGLSEALQVQVSQIDNKIFIGSE